MQIKELTLYTSKLNAQKEFYCKVLNIPLHKESDNYIEFIIGNSLLRFVFKPDSKPYHIAFNIPSNQEVEALKWLKQRVVILKHFNNEMIDFVNWNAKAIYFYDADKNIVEFIARKNLKEFSTLKFTANSLLEISEIGLPVQHIENAYSKLNSITKLDVYFGDFDKFCAIGDEKGLFITVDINHKNWFPTGDKIYASDFKVKIMSNDSNFDVEFKNGEILA